MVIEPSKPSFDELVQLLVGGNDPAVGLSGIVSDTENGEVVRRRRVWRLRDMARVEDPPGHTTVLAGERTYWQAGDDVDDEIWELRDEESRHILAEIRLMDPLEYWSEWLGTDRRVVVSTLHAVEVEGRAAWRFTAPEVKGGRPSVTVDAQTGLTLDMSRADIGYALTWSELRLEPDLGPRFFEPTHREPLVPRDPDPEPDQAWSLEDRRRILTALARANDDWRRVGELVAEADDAEAARLAVAAHLDVDEMSAQAVLDMQYRQLTKLHRSRVREELHALTRQIAEPASDRNAGPAEAPGR